MKYIIVCILFILTSCASSANYIHPFPKQVDVYKALYIILDEFEADGLYTKEKMSNVLNSNDLRRHWSCKSKDHHIEIVFETGSWSKKHQRYCIYSPSFKDKCLVGLFNGYHRISMINKDRIHNTSFAHELLHYFRKYIDGVSPRNHNPKILWKGYVGHDVDGIGIVNEALKKKGF